MRSAAASGWIAAAALCGLSAAVPAHGQAASLAHPTGPVVACAQDPRPHLCGFDGPEDLADLKGAPFVIVSQDGGPSGTSGLAAIDTRDGTITRYGVGDIVRGRGATAGDRACAPPAAWKTGGIGVRRQRGGWRLAVINHAGDDRVELLDVMMRRRGPPLLFWAGCVSAPAYALNDIAPLPDGGVAATHMFDRASAADRAALVRQFLRGDATGYVVRWSPGAGWRKLPGTDGSFPNGLDVSADGHTLYYAETYGHRVTSVPLDGGAARHVALSWQPDNVTTAAPGRVIVAGGTGAPFTSTADCASMKRAGCGFPSTAVSVDFGSGTVVPLFSDDGTTTPGASVALVKNGKLWIGAATGDRVTTVPMP